MAIGQRIKFFRNRKGMTQKQLGEQLGFKGKTSDVRMAQYESEARVPKIDLVKQISQIFDINTHALTVPDIDTHIGLMHTLFALEDMYGLKVKNVDGQPHLCLDSSISAPGSSVDEIFRAWMKQADKLENGEISKEEYDEWRYKYPELDTYQKRAKVPSQELSDYLVKHLGRALNNIPMAQCDRIKAARINRNSHSCSLPTNTCLLVLYSFVLINRQPDPASQPKSSSFAASTITRVSGVAIGEPARYAST